MTTFWLALRWPWDVFLEMYFFGGVGKIFKAPFCHLVPVQCCVPWESPQQQVETPDSK